jgi:SAM-dependent methyltransferase
VQDELPDFHEGGSKLGPLSPESLSDGDYSSQCLAFLQLLDGSLAGKMVLDVGCGRGELVMRLRQLGVRAFGIEVEPRYVHSGQILNQLYQDDFPVIQLMQPGASFPYPDDIFDTVASFQVLEHVRDLEPLAREIGRVLRPGGETLHVLPAKYRIVEPHFFLPFVHWLPKSQIRARFISALVRLGLGGRVVRGHDRQSRAASIYHYSNTETFFRSPRQIARAFADAGLTSDDGSAAKAFILSRVSVPASLAGVLAPIVNLFRTTIVCARKSGRSRL